MKKATLLLSILTIVFCTSGCIFSNNDENEMIVNEETTNSEPSIKIVLLLHTSPSTIPDEGTIVEYRFRGTYISELILDVEFGVGLPNGFIGVFGAAKHLNYLVVRANNKWHWNVLEQ